jgi:transcriptional regulator with XRE-family HTH domain
MVSLGQKIRQRRLEKKLTQAQLAEGLASPSAISQIEADKINPSYKLLCQIADRLEVPLDYFLEHSEEYLEQTTSHKLAKTFIHAKEYTKALPILEKLLENGGETHSDLLYDLATCYLQLRNDSLAHHYLEQVMYLSLRDDDHQMYMATLKQLGLLFYRQNNISLALHYWQKAYDHLKRHDVDDTYLKAEVITNLAIAHNRLGNYDLSMRLFQESQQLLDRSANLHLIATNLLGLGYSFYGKRDFKTAEKYCQEAITLFKNLDHIRMSISVKENFAILRSEHGDNEYALSLLKECLKEYQDHNFSAYSSNAHSEIAKILIRLRRFEEAVSHIEQAFQTCEEGTIFHAQCFFVRSQWFHAQKMHQEAIADARTAMNHFLQIEAIHEYSQVSLQLSQIYKELGDYKSSTEILEQSQLSIQTFFKERGITI